MNVFPANNIMVGAKSLMLPTALTVTAAAYSAGHAVGGPLTFTDLLRTVGGSGLLVSALMTCKVTTFTGPADLFLFAAPLAGTYTDKAAFNMDADDVPNLLGVMPLTVVTSAGTGPVVISSTPGKIIALANKAATKTKNIYGVLVTRSGVTMATTADVSLALQIESD